MNFKSINILTSSRVENDRKDFNQKIFRTKINLNSKNLLIIFENHATTWLLVHAILFFCYFSHFIVLVYICSCLFIIFLSFLDNAFYRIHEN